MVRRTRRWVLSSAAGFGASLAIAGRASANSGTQLPDWGETPGTGDLQAGPLGLNPALDPGQVPVAMRIPDAGVDAEIERQQIVDGQMLDPSGPWVVAWYEQTARCGAMGNCVGSGHVDYWGVGPSVFHEVSSLQEGAQIEVIGKSGATYIYEVEYVQRIDVTSITPEELNSPEIVGRTDYAAITLVTCGGNFDGEVYTERDIIRGRLATVEGVEGEPADTEEEVPADDGAAGEEGDGALAEGSQATINTDGVNLRSEPTTSSEIVTELNSGIVVTITGASQEADDYTWWPIALEDGTTGWIAEDFLDP